MELECDKCDHYMYLKCTNEINFLKEESGIISQGQKLAWKWVFPRCILKRYLMSMPGWMEPKIQCGSDFIKNKSIWEINRKKKERNLNHSKKINESKKIIQN